MLVATMDAAGTTDATVADPAPGRGRLRLVAGFALVAVAAGVAGWQAPHVAAKLDKPRYLGESAAVLAADLGCENYAASTNHDETVYEYHDQGTCSLEGTVVTITTFDRTSDARAFESVMKALIPVVHPTWQGATYAAGEAWNVADARNLTPQTAELVVRRLGDGATHIIPFSPS